MLKDSLITGLDVGSTTIRMVVGQKSRQDEKLKIVGAIETPAQGISKGVVVSVEDAVSSISAALEKLERMVGQPIDHAWVGISGSHITAQESKGLVAVSKADGEIRPEDVERVIEAARAMATPPNYEILHVIPKSFTVDYQTGIKDPIGMTGVRLEVETQIIQGLTSQIKNLTKCIYRTGLNIDDLILSALATAESVLTSRQKELGVVVINFGGATTSIAVFEEGDVIHTAVLPVGSEYVTNDIAIGLRISIDTAEKIKIREGSCLPQNFKKHDEVRFADIGGIEDGSFSKRQVAEIVEARVEEIMEWVDKELKRVGRSGMLPAGAVITGNGAKLDGVIEVAKKSLRLPASLGYPQELISSLDKVSDLSFTTAVGLVLWGSQSQSNKRRGLPGVDTIPRKIKDLIKSLLP
ncbi:MAG TPA: cell division protein FtsA [bacterium]|nr:cell division protein FtsA [bacterium]HNZ73020.1 cell division protein FtsA [bacterium]HOH67116.1 cell division protein FtsA [bacterium]HQA64048.1 cell division protein FtsA [bacterium]